MAMLGLLELMASQGATTDQIFEAAKNIDAFWFPQQTLVQQLVTEGVGDQLHCMAQRSSGQINFSDLHIVIRSLRALSAGQAGSANSPTTTLPFITRLKSETL